MTTTAPRLTIDQLNDVVTYNDPSLLERGETLEQDNVGFDGIDDWEYTARISGTDPEGHGWVAIDTYRKGLGAPKFAIYARPLLGMTADDAEVMFAHFD